METGIYFVLNVAGTDQVSSALVGIMGVRTRGGKSGRGLSGGERPSHFYRLASSHAPHYPYERRKNLASRLSLSVHFKDVKTPSSF